MENFFLEWPDVSLRNFQASGRNIALPSVALCAIRSGEVNHLLIESSLLAYRVSTQVQLEDQLIALGFLYFSCIDLSSFISVVDKLRCIAPERLEVRAFTVLGWLWKKDIPSVASAPSGIWKGLNDSLLLRICKAYYLLQTDRVDAAFSLVKDEKKQTLEIYLIKAKVLAAKGCHLEAVHLLKSISERVNSNLRFYRQLLQHQMDAKDGSDIKQNIATLQLLVNILRSYIIALH